MSRCRRRIYAKDYHTTRLQPDVNVKVDIGYDKLTQATVICCYSNNIYDTMGHSHEINTVKDKLFLITLIYAFTNYIVLAVALIANFVK